MPETEMLNPRLKDWLVKTNALMARQKAQGVAMTPSVARESLAVLTAALVSHKPKLPWVGDTQIETRARPVAARLYDPAPERDKAVCLLFHGGGHMAGDIEVYDPIGRKLAEASGQLVVSVDYRRAPESPYPLGLNDCLDAAGHLWPALEREQRRFRRRLCLIGDSGGGAYAASISALAQHDSQLAIDQQVLIYPSLDYTLSFPSVAENGVGYLLEKDRIRWYFDHYFQHGEDRQAASPLAMPISARLPQTLMITAGFCPLRDEGLAYLDRLRAAGVSCKHQHFESMIHAYLNMEDLVPEACAATYQAIGEFLNAD